VTAAILAATIGPAAALLATTAASSPQAVTPGSKVAVPQGIGMAALRSASVFGNTAASTPETVSFVLKERNLGALEAAVESGKSASPSGGDISVADFAALYGQPQSVISGLESYLAQFGITTSAYANGIDVTATGTAGEFDTALSVTQKNYSVPAVKGSDGRSAIPAQTVHGTTQPLMLPGDIASHILSVLGLTNYSSFVTNLVHKPQLLRGAKVTSTFTGNLTPADFAKNYNLTPLYSKGATGAGQRIGIVTLASLNPADPQYFWNNVLKISTPADKITLDNVDGGAGAVSATAGSDETTLDVEQSGAIAPGASITVYQAPNTDAGYLDAFLTAASQNTADSVSSSWGESETFLAASVAAGQESATYVQAYDEAFLELAAQGQSTFAASGDAGAYDASRDLGTTNLSVDNPGDSPFIISAGGTTLAGNISATLTTGGKISTSVPAQRTWGWDYLWPLWKAFGATSETAFVNTDVVGGGGGFSAVEPTPRYQEGVSGTSTFSAVPYLTPTTPANVDGLTLPTAWTFNPTPTVITGSATGRATPDLSTDADPFTGYELYFTGFTGAALESGWGGTSFVAPQLAGATAVIDQFTGGRTGFWNPSIYSFASSSDSPFTPLSTSGTTNDNVYYTGTPGQIFNAGSGLGIPNLAKLAVDFAGNK
jgi:subtilase family serine protease